MRTSQFKSAPVHQSSYRAREHWESRVPLRPWRALDSQHSLAVHLSKKRPPRRSFGPRASPAVGETPEPQGPGQHKRDTPAPASRPPSPQAVDDRVKAGSSWKVIVGLEGSLSLETCSSKHHARPKKKIEENTYVQPSGRFAASSLAFPPPRDLGWGRLLPVKGEPGLRPEPPRLRRGKPLTARPQPGNSFWGGGGNGMNEIVCWCPGWSVQGVFAPLRACCSRGSGAWALVRYLALVRAGGVWVRQPALFPVVVRRQARLESQATERGEDPGLPPGKRPPDGLLERGF